MRSDFGRGPIRSRNCAHTARRSQCIFAAPRRKRMKGEARTPEPLTPVSATSLFNGISRSMFFRLCAKAAQRMESSSPNAECSLK